MYRHGGHLDLWTMTICIYFQSPFNIIIRLHMTYEEIWPRDFREVVQRCEHTKRQTKGRRKGSDHNSSS